MASTSVQETMEKTVHQLKEPVGPSPYSNDDETTLEFYKNGERVETTRVYKYLGTIDVTEYDKVVIKPNGFLPYIEQKIKGKRCNILVAQSGNAFAHTVDLTNIDTLNLVSDLHANKAIERIYKFDYDSTDIDDLSESDEGSYDTQ